MSIFFLSLTVSVTFGLWELCSSGKHSHHPAMDHPSKGRRRSNHSDLLPNQKAAGGR